MPSYASLYIADDGSTMAGPIVIAGSQKEAEWLANEFVRVENGSFIQILGQIVHTPALSKSFVAQTGAVVFSDE